MTLTLVRPSPADRPGPTGRGRATARTFSVRTWPTVIGAAIAGVLVVGLSYRLSATGYPPALYYALFWAGMTSAVLPVAARIVLGGDRDRATAVVLLGVLTFVPKYLRNPFAPAYHDEYAHWREAVDVLASHELFQPNGAIPIIQFFPGTSGLTAVVTSLTGLPVWQAGELIELMTHVLALFGVFVLVQALLGSARSGGIAAVVYALNPSFVYFDTQYAYEGIAIAFFCWVLALASLAARARGRRRVAYVVAAVVCGAGSVVTHHLTTLFLVLTLVTVAAAHHVLRRPGARTWWAVCGGVTAAAATWLTLVAWQTVSYLSPYLGGSVGQLSRMAARTDTGRILLAPSVQPLWERGLTALAPVVVGLLFVRAAWLLRRTHREWRADTLALMALGAVYFPSVLFLLAPSGAEGARRSWAFTYVGIALVVAYVAERSRVRGDAWVRLAVVAVLLVGNVGAGLNDPYRFPGPFRWGTDTTSASAEARTTAEALAAAAGPVRVITDRYTGLQMIAYGGLDVAAASAGFPAGDLVQSPYDPPRDLAMMIVGSNYDYLVVDTRIADQPAFNGDNFGASDRLPGRATPRAQLDRLDRVPWAQRVMSTDHVRVYRLDLILLGQTVRSAP